MEFSFLSDYENPKINNIKMVDVTDKEITVRKAVAKSEIALDGDTFDKVRGKKIKKGDVLAVAQIAGIMAAKKNSEIIPLCHPINITDVDITFNLLSGFHKIEITATVKCKGETGVEMEALTAATVAALTIYDMCKSEQRDIKISNIRLIEKSGGKSGNFSSEER